MCLPWHFLLLPSAELLPSIQISVHADLVQPVICYLWEENMTGAAAGVSGAPASSGAPQVETEGGVGGVFHSALAELGAE